MNIIDTHTTVPKLGSPRAQKFPIFRKATEEGLLSRMDELNVKRAIFFNNSRSHELSVEYNAWGASLVRKYPDRLVCYASVYPPNIEAALEELRRCIRKPEFKGLKLHPRAQSFMMNDPSSLRVIEEAQNYDIPVVLHVTSAANEPLPPEQARALQKKRDETEGNIYSASKWLIDVINVYNSPNVISAHMGGLYTPEIQESKITFQTAGACSKAIQYACDSVGPERVIYGSDFPFFEISDEINKVEKAEISQGAKRKILGDNAEKMGLL